MNIHALHTTLLSISLLLPGLVLLSERHLVVEAVSCPSSSVHYPLTPNPNGCECKDQSESGVACIQPGIGPGKALYLECESLPALVKEDNFTEFVGCL